MRPGWAVKAILVIIITSILIRCVFATNHTVGGSSGWDLASNLQAWSSATTFHVADSCPALDGFESDNNSGNEAPDPGDGE
nr:uclacyanin 1 [Quercus suber]